MTEFVRPIYEHVEDLFILDVEALCNFAYELEYYIPDSLSESEFHATFGSILEESSDCLIVREPSGGGEQVVLHGGDGSHSYLRGEVAHLVLAQAEVLLALLEYDFQGPSHGVNPVGLDEVKLAVGCDETVPLCPLVALAEEQAHIASGKDDIHGDMVASQTAAVLAPLLGMVEEIDELVGGVLLTFIHVLRAAHLNHAEIVARHMAGGDEPDDVGTCEPAVGQDVVEVYLLLDDAPYHLYHQGNLALVVFLNTPGCVGVLGMLLGEAGIELLLLQAVVPFLALLTDERKVYQHLAPAVSDAEEKGLETKHHRMGDVGENLTDKLRLYATLGVVRVIHHQTDWLRSFAGALLLRLTPQLPRHRGEYLAPVVGVSRKKPVERVALQTVLAA